MSSIFDKSSEFHKNLGETPKSSKSNEFEKAEPIKNQKQSDAFVLDLRNLSQNKSQNIAEKKKSTELKPHKLESKKTDLLKKLNAKSTVKDFISTSLKALLIFIVTIVALNFDGFYSVFEPRISDLLGIEKENPLKNLADTSLNSMFTEDSLKLPPLNKEIIPPGNRIILPRLGKNVPIIDVPEERLLKRDWNGLERDIQNALRDGVVHYPGTPDPDQSGNFVLTGHSSYFPWDPGRFKDVFAVLHNVVVGDQIIVYHEMKKFTYQIEESFVITPDQISVLGDSGDDRITLITCTPLGTNLKRLIVVAKPI
jgi:LPXTG-site transpeptidase (sortase) family protein